MSQTFSFLRDRFLRRQAQCKVVEDFLSEAITDIGDVGALVFRVEFLETDLADDVFAVEAEAVQQVLLLLLLVGVSSADTGRFAVDGEVAVRMAFLECNQHMRPTRLCLAMIETATVAQHLSTVPTVDVARRSLSAVTTGLLLFEAIVTERSLEFRIQDSVELGEFRFKNLRSV